MKSMRQESVAIKKFFGIFLITFRCGSRNPFIGEGVPTLYLTKMPHPSLIKPNTRSGGRLGAGSL